MSRRPNPNLQPIDCARYAHAVDRREDPNNFTCACGQVTTDNEKWRGQPFSYIYSDQEYGDFQKKHQPHE